MPHLHQLVVFLAGTAIIVAVPGPNILYLIARSVHQGRAAGLASLLGIECATLLHICAATLGLTSILLSSAVAFQAIKYLGAAYLVYLGVRKLLAREEQGPREVEPPRELRQVFLQGFLVNLLNPKTALFFLAYLPQFVEPRYGSVPSQILSFGLCLILVGTCIELAYVLLATRLRGWLAGDDRSVRGGRYLAGGAYVGLGVATALADR